MVTMKKKVSYFVLCLFLLNCYLESEPKRGKLQKDTANTTKARKEMVDTQIKPRGIEDPKVLLAMYTVPRHFFVEKQFLNLAYSDTPLPIGHSQTISQPYIVAYMTELLNLKGEEKVLEVGTGCGYQTAVLAEIAKEVYSIEIVKPLCKLAEQNLSQFSYKNIRLQCGDGYRGWKENAPFDRILVAAAPDHIPKALKDQLAIGGIMVIPVGNYHQELIVIKKKSDGSLSEEKVLPVRFVPMTGEAQK